MPSYEAVGSPPMIAAIYARKSTDQIANHKREFHIRPDRFDGIGPWANSSKLFSGWD